jgi:hypothetical protein
MMGTTGPNRVVELALRCYPRGWKARHGDEAAQLARLLADDGVPPASIALSYLSGALRERLAPLVRRRWRARAAALVAAASIAGTSLAMSTSPAPAAAVGVVRVEVTQRSEAVTELTSAFRAHHFSVAVRQVPAPANEVGSIVGALVTGPPSPSRAIISEVKGPCADGATGCVVGLVIPANFSGSATVLVGRPSWSSAATAKTSARHHVDGNTEERNG